VRVAENALNVHVVLAHCGGYDKLTFVSQGHGVAETTAGCGAEDQV
jgi:hypothetical protein